MAIVRDPELRWPAVGDQLFRASTHWADARVAKDTRERFSRMAEGYKRAGDLLTQHAEQDVVDRHNLVYPAVFCYRQYIELTLKECIEDYGSKIGIAPDRRHHGLVELWQRFEQILHSYGHNPNCSDVVVVGNHIAQFANIDPRSFTFRYAMEKDGSEFQIQRGELDLVNLRNVMETIYTFFDCVSSYFHSLVLQENYAADFPDII